ncbi:hypothetical protein D3C71_1767870 [compost metagenome]
MDAFAARRDAGGYQRHDTGVDGDDLAKTVVAGVGAAKVRRWIRVAEPYRPVGEHHATIDLAWLPRARVVGGEKGV